MKFSPEERRQKRERFRTMSPAQKLEHIWLYYKAPLLLAVAAVVVLGSVIYRVLSKKEPVLFVACLNVSMGADLESRLSEGFLSHLGVSPQETEVRFYKDLYLSDDASENHEYAYASKMKVLAAINARQMDLVLMNREAYDLCSGSGYLLDLTTLFPPGHPDREKIRPYLTSNLVILEDNAIAYSLNEAEEYEAVTESVANALDLCRLPLFQNAGFSDRVYLGVIANTPRPEECAEYVGYLVCQSAQ